jgi:phage baseplate assembly protein W
MPQTDAQLMGRGIAFPPRVDTEGRLAWSEGANNVREAIRIILSTERRERVMLPEFGGGLRRFLFEPNTPATHRLIQETIKRAVGRWEPRVHVESVQVITDPDEPQGAIATLHYRLVATQITDRVDINLRLGA